MKKFIEDLKLGEKLNSVFRLRDFSEKPRKDGSSFLVLELMDRSGQIAAKIWDNVEQLRKILEKGALYTVRGEVTEYNGRLELRVDSFQKAAAIPQGLREEDFRFPDKVDIAALSGEFRDFFETRMKSPAYRGLWQCFWRRYQSEFTRHPGAQKVHHAFPGGLMLHTLSMARLAESVARHYGLNLELLLAGVLLHDSGKMREFTSLEVPEMTLEGGLNGHVMLSIEILQELLAEVPEFPGLDRICLKHLILSHHGEKEFGAVETPKIAEAFALHLLDMLDSRIDIFNQMADSRDSGTFSDYNAFLKGRVLLKTSLAQPPEEQSPQT
jgi:3'-5' exoribonuclease